MKTLQLLPPSPIQKIVETLHEQYEVYYVGGCVRDFLLNREIHDYDAATSASVEEMKKALSSYKIIETGIAHGTLTIVNQHEHIEITTFRIDQNYLDHRKPEKVLFTRSLHEDLKRRDFTINALACDPDGNLIDEHHGVEDLNNRIIRCIGSASQRFNEDALRILRAIRFAYMLDFQIEKECEKAIFECLPLLEKISIERKVDELFKILMVPNKNPAMILKKYDLFSYFDILDHDGIVHELESYPCEIDCRIAAFFDDTSYAIQTLRKWHCSKKMIQQVSSLVKYKHISFSNDPYMIRKLIDENGIEMTRKILQLKKMDLSLFEKITNEEDYLLDLAIKGSDCVELGFKGQQISGILKKCRELVYHDLHLNTREYLLEWLKKEIERK